MPARLAAVGLPLWAWWVAVVDHMGRNGSSYGLWSRTDGRAPWWPVGVTAALTGYGHGRGIVLLVLLVAAWVVDVRTLWAGGYTLMIEGDDGGGRWGPWRWRTWHRLPRGAWGRLPGSGWGALAADAVDLVAVVGIEARWAGLTLREAAATHRPRLLARAPGNLRVAREEAARAELDPAPRRWWRVRLLTLVVMAACAGLVLLTPAVTHDLAVSLQEVTSSPFWLAGILDALGTLWDSLSWEQKAGLVVLAGALVVLSGGTLGLALDVGLGLTTVMGAAHGAADLVRNPTGTVRRYLATHTPGEVAADVAMAVLTVVGGGGLGLAGGQVGRGAYAAYREADYAAWLWRTDREAWRRYAAGRSGSVRRFLEEEAGTVRRSSWDPANGTHYPGLRQVRPGRSDGGPGTWGLGRNHGSARAQAYEEQVTGVDVRSSYHVHDVEFDGYDGFALVEAKGEGYSTFLDARWAPDVVEEFSIQAQKQLDAVRAVGSTTPVRWEIAEPDVFTVLQKAQGHNEFPTGIQLSHTPPRP